MCIRDSIEAEADCGDLAVRADAELLVQRHGFAQRNLCPLTLVEECDLKLDKADVLPGVGQFYRLRHIVQHHAVRGRCLGNDILAQIKLIARRYTVRAGGYGVDHRAGRYSHASVRGEYILSRRNGKCRACVSAGLIYRGVQPVRLVDGRKDLADLGYAYNTCLLYTSRCV